MSPGAGARGTGAFFGRRSRPSEAAVTEKWARPQQCELPIPKEPKPMRIAEIYMSVQGEGLLTGEPSVFIRSSGCNLRCRFCDTPYASWRPEGEDLEVAEILRRTLELDLNHVVITGGEPLVWSEMIPLTQRLRSAGLHVTIETAGTLFLPVACDLMSLSPKLSNSTPSPAQTNGWAARHERDRHNLRVARQLAAIGDFQLKFVIDRPEDLDEVEGWLREFGDAGDRVWLMPQGTDINELAARQTWLAAACQQRGYRLCPRKQIEWFGLKRGT